MPILSIAWDGSVSGPIHDHHVPSKYASQLSAQFFLTKTKVHILLFEESFAGMHAFFMLDIQCQFVNVSLKRLNQSSQFIMHSSSSCLNIRAKELVVDVGDGVV